MLGEILVLRRELRADATRQPANGDLNVQTEDLDKQLEELAGMLSALQAQEERQHRENLDSHSEIEAEINRLREAVRRIEMAGPGGPAAGGVSGGAGSSSVDGSANIGTSDGDGDEQVASNAGGAGGGGGTSAEQGTGSSSGGPVSHSADGEYPNSAEAGTGSSSYGPGSHSGGIDGPSNAGVGPPYMENDDDAPSAPFGHSHRGDQVDTDMAMPYGDLEPFGREDTARELTEDSIRQSNAMVDQIERAEVSEEKRSVFRALTRLRGAAITSYDGIARSQTGNIDDYARQNQWRTAHPVHHLADDEADVSKWAFPDNDS